MFKLGKILEVFCSFNESTQKSIAGSFHELTALLKTQAYKLLRDTFDALLSTGNEEIIELLLHHFEVIVTHFSSSALGKQGLEQVLHDIIQLETEIGDKNGFKWRFRLKLIRCLRFMHYSDSETLPDTYVPILVQKLYEVFIF